jgi:RHS repeat-associated protein
VYDTGTGQVRAINSPEGISLAYEYDGHLRTATLWSGTVAGTVRNTYDANFLVTQETVNGQFPVTYGYDQDGIVNSVGALQITRTAGNGALLGTTVQQVTSTNTLNAFAEPLGLEYRFASNPMIQWTYNRGTTGRIQGITETIAGTTVTTTFGYDAAGRLATATRDGQVQATYEYDANGNRLRVTRPSGSVVGVYDVQDRLLSYGTTQYTYSAVGELLMKVAGADTTRYRYDPSGALVGVRLAQGDSIQYVLDGGGRRVARKVNGVLVSAFIYHNQVAPVAELDGTGAIVSRFVYATSEHVPAYMLKQGRTYRILADHLGSVRMVVDVETGAIAQRIDYDEFGRPTSNTNLGFQPFGYAGGMVDDATGLVHFGMREYDPEVGRWTTKDPILFEGGDGNLYSYVTGDPINLSDPEGTSFLGYFFQKYVIEEILWRIASDVAGGVLGGCFGSWMESGNLAGCPEEAIRGAQFRLSTGFAGGLILHGRYAKRNSLGQFTKGYPRKWNWMENFFVMCLDGAVSGLDVDKVNGDLEQGSDWVSSAAYGCAMGGLGALNELLGKWIIARPALKGRMRIARAVPFVLSSVLDAFGTAFEKRFDAFTEDMMTPGTPCCSENPPGTFVRRLPRRPVGSTEALGSGQEQQR